MGQKIAKKSPKWQKTPKSPRRHVAKPGEGGRSVVTSTIMYNTRNTDTTRFILRAYFGCMYLAGELFTQYTICVMTKNHSSVVVISYFFQ